MQKESKGFGTVFIQDMKRGMRQNRIKYLVILFFTIACCCIMYRICHGKIGRGLIAGMPNFMDYLLYIMQGCSEFKASGNTVFNIPPTWIFVQMMASFLVFSYVVKDLDKQGMIMLIKSADRTKWWLSKCIWNIATIVVMYLVIWCGVLIVAVSTNKMGFLITKDICREVLDMTFTQEGIQYSLIVMFMPLIMSLGISLMQMALSLVIGPIFSFTFVLAVDILSVYFLSPFLIGNYSIMMRSDYIISNGVNSLVGALISIVLGLAGVMLGNFYFKKYDILNKM
ncbi:hypothetical protein [[Clostridium] fimetarium]|uniref:ABC-2 family transporter protein n=1 Tax=[Clostridium] fimetarium TaxID=99656 RepID=A0A1I0NJV3_9FIRM|nr:hypothetical protein [[Clostridium] fimetarium]SEW01738.1 hypothetical protein SAMN05421659_103167 [[Clostridium] fimetarium]